MYVNTVQRLDVCTYVIQRWDVCMYYMYVCMYVLYVSMYVCTICMYVCTICMYVCMYVLYVCMYVLLYVRMYVCMYGMYVYTPHLRYANASLYDIVTTLPLVGSTCTEGSADERLWLSTELHSSSKADYAHTHEQTERSQT